MFGEQQGEYVFSHQGLKGQWSSMTFQITWKSVHFNNLVHFGICRFVSPTELESTTSANTQLGHLRIKSDRSAKLHKSLAMTHRQFKEIRPTNGRAYQPVPRSRQIGVCLI